MTTVRRRDGYAEELLRRHKDQLLLEIDEQIGLARMVGRTPSRGQDVVYALKEAEARTLLLSPREPVTEQTFPFLMAEALATGKTPANIAEEIVTAADAERRRLAMLEGLRMGFKARVKAASTTDEADAQRDAFQGKVTEMNVPIAAAEAARLVVRQQGRN